MRNNECFSKGIPETLIKASTFQSNDNMDGSTGCLVFPLHGLFPFLDHIPTKENKEC